MMRGLWAWIRSIFDDRIYGPEGGDPPVPFTQVLADERAAIAEGAAWRDCDAALPGESGEPATAEDQDLVGLAFSGGGIRSATFNLGLIQALADLRLLRRFDYLSTVSGGSYIGSWLTALIHRENRKPAEKGKPYGLCRVEQRLRTVSEQTGGRPAANRQDGGRCTGSKLFREDPAVTFLRRYSNYLTPRVGLFTADTWAVLSIYLRNLILNLTLLAAGLAAFLLLPRLVVAVTLSVSDWRPEAAPSLVFWATLGMILLLGVTAALLLGSSFSSLMVRERPRSDDEAGDEPDDGAAAAGEEARKLLPKPGQSTVLWQGALPLVLSMFLLSRWLPAARLEPWYDWSIWVAAAYGGGWALAWIGALWRPRGEPQDHTGWLRLVITAILGGLLTGPLLAAVGGMLRGLEGGTDDWVFWVCGLPLILLWLLLLGLLQTGLMGHGHRDHQREWLSRFGGWLLIFATVWALWFAMIVYAPVVLLALQGWAGGAAVSGWLAATLSGLAAARSRPTGKGSSMVQSLVLATVPYVFVGGLLAALAVGVDWGVSQLGDKAAWAELETEREKLLANRRAENEVRQANEVSGRPNVEREAFWRPLYEKHGKLLEATSRDWPLILGLVLALLAAACVLSWRIDVNEFSMHGFYRNRLARCYLGASVDPEERHLGKQPFSGFHESDDIALGDLFPAGRAHDRRHGKPAPIHLINTSLNLVGGEELAWQQRKAAPFVLSPLYCGFDPREESFRHDANQAIDQHGYRRTVTGTRDDRNYGSYPVPLTLGSAVAISGAAASPNMGFHSTPALAFLLTVFNIRIGWWLGNPRHLRAWTRSGPFLAMVHLFMELFGKTRGRSRYVYLSDGEHFENLGVYELVRRRCRFILATDVGADPQYAFDNLGNAIRKCRADLGVEIEIDADPIKARGEDGLSKWHCAVGKIHYPLAGGGTELGTLLYVKTSLTGDEPADVLAYARANPPFPHQTTADQFFDESQFESYRRLGHHVAMEVLKDSVEAATEAVEVTETVEAAPAAAEASPASNQAPLARRSVKKLKLEKLLLELNQRWYPPLTAATEAFVRHTETLDRLFERARQTPDLAFLDAQIYPEWHRFLDGAERPDGALVDQRTDSLWLPESAEERRQGFYFCNSLIQLMENVYLDLDLDHDYAHPDHRGWMNLFKHWSWSGLFRATWAICAATYGHRFQAFCRQRLDLELGEVEIHRLRPPASEAFTAESFRGAAETEGPAFLNFLEREQIGVFLSHGDTEICEVAQFELSVDGTAVGRGEAEKILRFGFGYALLAGGGRVVLMRIQDHLRIMGLGRKALGKLIRKGARREDPVIGEFDRSLAGIDREHQGSGPAAEACRRFSGEFRGGEKQFVALLQSVRREVQEEETSSKPRIP